MVTMRGPGLGQQTLMLCVSAVAKSFYFNQSRAVKASIDSHSPLIPSIGSQLGHCSGPQRRFLQCCQYSINQRQEGHLESG